MSSRLAKLEARLVDLLEADQQPKDLARVLRLPGSVNPRVNRLVKVIYYELDNEFNPEELEQRLLEKGDEKKDKAAEGKHSRTKVVY